MPGAARVVAMAAAADAARQVMMATGRAICVWRGYAERCGYKQAAAFPVLASGKGSPKLPHLCGFLPVASRLTMLP